MGPRIALLLAVFGCGEPLRIVALDAWTGDVVLYRREYLHDGCAILGLECEQVDTAYGAVVVKFLNVDSNGVQGCILSKEDATGCRRAVVSTRNANVVAHELMHALGYPSEDDHSTDPDSVLNTTPGDVVTDAEQARIDRHAGRVGACR